MNLDAKLEEAIESRAMQHLTGGRPEFDVSHTLFAVRFMKELVKAEGGNERILVTVMYLHDIGYCGLIKDGYSLDEVIQNKELHAERGASEAGIILADLGYSPHEIEEAVYLIRNHDNLAELDKNGEKALQLVFEADGLGQLAAPPTFVKEEHARALAWYEKERAPRFKTAKGKSLLTGLLEEVRQRYK